ncbi:hypothetical protein Fmac_028213 [Flemingia macrophylla]|uniref:Uncharacterized protein n=1 Tax=Flemingia macrophylla TaxID=520843 RepID=A0ABD1L6V0_9FABA
MDGITNCPNELKKLFLSFKTFKNSSLSRHLPKPFSLSTLILREVSGRVAMHAHVQVGHHSVFDLIPPLSLLPSYTAGRMHGNDANQLAWSN